jgi:hypothetical protein
MVHKRISSHRTNTGYSIHVFVKDGEHVKKIIEVLERYFKWASGELEDERKQRILEEVNNEAEQLKAASTLKEIN